MKLSFAPIRTIVFACAYRWHLHSHAIYLAAALAFTVQTVQTAVQAKPKQKKTALRCNAKKNNPS